MGDPWDVVTDALLDYEDAILHYADDGARNRHRPAQQQRAKVAVGALRDAGLLVTRARLTEALRQAILDVNEWCGRCRHRAQTEDLDLEALADAVLAALVESDDG